MLSFRGESGMRVICLLCFLPVLGGCFKSHPNLQDGNLSIELYVKYEDQLLADIPVSLQTYDYNISTVHDTTDSTGRVFFENLPWAQYRINIKSEAYVPSFTNPDETDTVIVVGNKYIAPENKELVRDTIYTIASGTQPGLKINELYTCGPPNDFFYYFDQYIELYNSAEDTIYLDGMVICRMWQFLEDITYIFQFPGEPFTGRQYPVPPDSFVVIARDAYNHRAEIFDGEKSIDLTTADFEFRNSMDYGDYDNPEVPNLDNIEAGHTRDFGLNLTTDVVLIADGSDLEYIDGMDPESVIDCVEYASYAEHTKSIESFLDRGFGGVGQIRYSGQSLERIAPGFDTNNSTVDFRIIPHPTPGYQYTGED